MLNKEPIVSVIIPTYNRESTIERAVRSVLKQTYQDFEVIVVDDGSSDYTSKLMENLLNEDPRVRYLRNETNRGAQVIRNIGIQEALGEYIAFLDSDNEWLPRKLELQMNLFKDRASNCGVVYTGFQYEYDDGRLPRYIKPYFRGNIYRDSLRQWIADTSTIVVRKDLIIRAGLFDERIRAFQEWDLCIRLARYAEFDFVDDILVIYHVISHIMTISKDSLNSANGYMDIVSIHCDEIVQELGHDVLSKHLMNAAHFFIKEGDYSSALRPLKDLIRISPFYWRALIYWLLCKFRPGLIPKIASLRRKLRFRRRLSQSTIGKIIMADQIMESSNPSNNGRERVAIFQASYPMRSHTINEALALAEADYKVDLFLYNVNQRYLGNELKNDNISIYYFRSQSYKDELLDKADNRSTKTIIFNLYDLLRKQYQKVLWLSPIWRLFGRPIVGLRERYLTWLKSDSGLLPPAVLKESHKIIKCHKYKAMIGIEKLGLIWAGIISKYQNIPYIYHSLELHESDHPYFIQIKDIFFKRLKLTETRYHRKSYATIIQDKRRAEVLFNDNGIKNGRVVYMPVSVPNEPFQRSSFLQQKFNISHDQIIIFQFGWIKESRFSLELAEMAQSFNQKWLLLFHGPAQGAIVDQIKKIDVNNRIIISQDIVPDDKIHELISSAHIGIVLYPSYDFNHYLTAFASEKLALKLRSGLPIIAFKYPGYEIIEEKRCGILINSIDEIPIAIEKILKSYSKFSHNARDCFLEHYEFSKNIKNVIQVIAEMS